MATLTANVGDTIQLFFEGQQHNLVICLRDGFPILPSETRQELLRETLKTWMYAWQAHLHKNDVSKYKSADEICEIEASQSDPYVTIYNKGYGFSITVQDSSTPQHGVNLASDFESAIATIREKVPALFQASETPKPEQKAAPKSESPASDKTIQFPSGETVTQAPSDNGGEIVSFRASRAFGDVIQIESGKPESSAWKDVIKAVKPYDAKSNTVNYKDGDLVAYQVTAPIIVKAPQEKVCMEVTAGRSKFTFWRNQKGTDALTFDWPNIEKQMFSVDVRKEELVAGFKLDMPCLLIIKFTQKDGKEYANFYGFRALPNQVKKASGE